jgi:type IV secretion system protein VirD4
LGRELLSLNELTIIPRDECILQINGVQPFHSKKYDITKHPDYKYLADYSRRNTFDIGKFLDTRAKLKSQEQYDVYEVGA